MSFPSLLRSEDHHLPECGDGLSMERCPLMAFHMALLSSESLLLNSVLLVILVGLGNLSKLDLSVIKKSGHGIFQKLYLGTWVVLGE